MWQCFRRREHSRAERTLKWSGRFRGWSTEDLRKSWCERWCAARLFSPCSFCLSFSVGSSFQVAAPAPLLWLSPSPARHSDGGVNDLGDDSEVILSAPVSCSCFCLAFGPSPSSPPHPRKARRPYPSQAVSRHLQPALTGPPSESVPAACARRRWTRDTALVLPQDMSSLYSAQRPVD